MRPSCVYWAHRSLGMLAGGNEWMRCATVLSTLHCSCAGADGASTTRRVAPWSLASTYTRSSIGRASVPTSSRYVFE